MITPDQSDAPIFRGKPQNPLDGRGRATARATNVMNLKSTGWGPSKLHADVSMPDLPLGTKALLCALDGKEMAKEALIEAISPPFSRGLLSAAERAIKQAVKDDYISLTSRGTYALMAEGRRIVGLLSE